MAKKKNKSNIIIVVLIGIVLLVALAYFTIPKKIDTGVNDQGVSLKAFGWKDGVKVQTLQITKNGNLFSTIELEPPSTPIDGIDAISIQHTLSSNQISEVDIDVSDLTGSFTSDGNGNLPL